MGHGNPWVAVDGHSLCSHLYALKDHLLSNLPGVLVTQLSTHTNCVLVLIAHLDWNWVSYLTTYIRLTITHPILGCPIVQWASHVITAHVIEELQNSLSHNLKTFNYTATPLTSLEKQDLVMNLNRFSLHLGTVAVQL